jgi:hypothetical protein
MQRHFNAHRPIIVPKLMQIVSTSFQRRSIIVPLSIHSSFPYRSIHRSIVVSHDLSVAFAPIVPIPPRGRNLRVTSGSGSPK